MNGSGPGTLIRWRTNKMECQRGAKGNRAGRKGELLAGWLDERFDLKGPKNPNRERRFNRQAKLLNRELGNGLVALISP